MPRLHETIETSLPAEDAFAFIADFANSQVWDPGVATAERIDPGPVGLGARYKVERPVARQGRPDGVPDHDL